MNSINIELGILYHGPLTFASREAPLHCSPQNPLHHIVHDVGLETNLLGRYWWVVGEGALMVEGHCAWSLLHFYLDVNESDHGLSSTANYIF